MHHVVCQSGWSQAGPQALACVGVFEALPDMLSDRTRTCSLTHQRCHGTYTNQRMFLLTIKASLPHWIGNEPQAIYFQYLVKKVKAPEDKQIWCYINNPLPGMKRRTHTEVCVFRLNITTAWNVSSNNELWQESFHWKHQRKGSLFFIAPQNQRAVVSFQAYYFALTLNRNPLKRKERQKLSVL